MPGAISSFVREHEIAWIVRLLERDRAEVREDVCVCRLLNRLGKLSLVCCSAKNFAKNRECLIGLSADEQTSPREVPRLRRSDRLPLDLPLARDRANALKRRRLVYRRAEWSVVKWLCEPAFDDPRIETIRRCQEPSPRIDFAASDEGRNRPRDENYESDKYHSFTRRM